MKIFYCLLLLTILSNVEAYPNDNFVIIEKAKLAELATPNIDDVKKFQIYMSLGKEAFEYDQADKSQEYYSKAIALNVDQDKSEAYINRIALVFSVQNKEQIKKYYQEADEYFSKNKKYKTDVIASYLNSLDDYLSKKGKKGGIFTWFNFQDNYKELIEKKKFLEAVNLFDLKKLGNEGHSYDYLIQYDVPNVSLKGRKTKHLYCSKIKKKYPYDYSPVVLLCALLEDYIATGSFDKKHMERALEYYNYPTYKNEMFMLNAVKDLLNKK